MFKKYCAIFLTISILISSCNYKIINPLIGGVIYVPNSINNKDSFIYQSSEKRTTIYVTPKNSLNVRAIEDCKILAVVSDKDSGKIIITKGKLDVGYGNLNKSYVSKGDLIFKGQVIAELFQKDSVRDNSLSISVEKDGKMVMPKW